MLKMHAASRVRHHRRRAEQHTLRKVPRIGGLLLHHGQRHRGRGEHRRTYPGQVPEPCKAVF